MKNKLLLTIALLSLGIGNAYANKPFSLGNGTIDGTANFSGVVSLSPLLGSSDIYDITCTVQDPTGETSPMQFAFSAQKKGNFMFIYSYDGTSEGVSSGNLYVIRDNNPHIIKFRLSGDNINYVNSVTFQWLKGTDMITPVSYSCTADYSQVNKKQI
jgi:hypothetical protein